jgi:uncharacterized protein (TIGR01777 family)
MKYLITGGTGFVGKHLIPNLIAKGADILVLTRDVIKSQRLFGDKVTSITNLKEISDNEQIYCIINLAGEPIADKKWSETQKALLLSSRVNITEDIIALISRLNQKPHSMISASAIGYYGCQADNVIYEDSQPINEFTHQLCEAWENEAIKAEKFGTRVCITRFGVVVGKEGGALAKMLPPFRLGLGGNIGSGMQYFSWVHINDLIRAIDFFITHSECSGIFNLTSPNAVTNQTFASTLADVLHRPAFFDMPAFICTLLFGEMGDRLLLHGQRVYPKRLIDLGFKFEFEDLESALKNLLIKNT